VRAPSALESSPPKGLRTRDIYIPDLHIDTIKVKSRDLSLMAVTCRSSDLASCHHGKKAALIGGKAS
jgi:hypothetical protein